MDNQQASPSPKTYVCMGTCQAVVSEEKYKGGLTQCGAKECTMYQKPFAQGHKDETTGKNVPDAPTQQ